MLENIPAFVLYIQFFFVTLQAYSHIQYYLMTTIETIFWLCVAVIFYTYIGYGIVLYTVVLLKRAFSHKKHAEKTPDDSLLPEVTIVICAYNEQDVVDMKMENTRALDYPKDKLNVMWVTDGSNDATGNMLARYPEVIVEHKPERRGKTAAVNRAMTIVKTEIVVMTDANTMINPGAIREVVRLFKDLTVGCVAGEKRVAARHDGQTAAEGEGLYWKYESTLKRLDSELYSAMGAAGELCAVRKELYRAIPEDSLLDDFIISMNMVAEGYRIAYASEAYAMEYGSADLTEEGKRKRRIAAGGLQSIWRLRRLMNPLRHPVVSFQFISHRVLRWSITPIAMMALIPLNVVLVMAKAGPVYTIIWLLQICFYAAAWVGYELDKKGKRNKLLYIPYYFLFMNINVFRGMQYLCNHRSGVWEKAKRG